MDVQAISAKLKTQFAGSAAAAGSNGGTDNSSPENAFSALLQLVGSKFGNASPLGGLESKLMHANDAAEAARVDARDDDAQNAPRPAVKAKHAKSDDKTSKAANDDDKSDSDANATQTDNTTDAQTANQTETAVQATVAAAVDVPVVTQATAAPVAVIAQDVNATAAAAPVATVAQTVAVTPETQIAAAAAVVAPEQVVAAAPVVTKAVAAATVETKTAADAPKATQSFTVAAADDTSDDTEIQTPVFTAAAVKTAAPKEAVNGPKEVRSPAAVEQSNTLAKSLDSDAKVQVQVQVTGRVQAAAVTDVGAYNHYVGYSADSSSTANGQAGSTDATNALVQAPKAVEIQAAPVAPIVLPPQLQAQAPAPAAARADASAPIQALEATSSSQGNQTAQGETGAGFESFHSTGSSQATGESRAASQTATERPQVTAQQVVDQIKVSITRAAKAGIDKVSISLKPEALGRIDVKLEMSDDQKVRVTVTADNKETLALLQSDSSSLQNALNDAGLRTDSANLHFSLREQSDPRAGEQSGNGGQNNRGNGAATADASAGDAADPSYDYAAAARSRGGIDTFA